MSFSTDSIQAVMARRSDDLVKLDLELVCTGCDDRLCDIEDGDYLEVLVHKAFEHVCPNVPAVTKSANEGGKADERLRMLRAADRRRSAVRRLSRLRAVRGW